MFLVISLKMFEIYFNVTPAFWDSLHRRLNNYYEAWSYRKEIDIDIPITSRNGDRKIIQSIRITSRPPSKIKEPNQFRCLDEHLPK